MSKQNQEIRSPNPVATATGAATEPARHLVYLSGPVTSKEPRDLRTWRSELQQLLGPNLEIFDPTRGPVVTQRLSEVANATANPAFKAFAREMVARNRTAISKCDLFIANLLQAHDVSIGTVGELFWADAFRRPILLVRDAHSNRHDHLMINEIATWIVGDIGQAAAIARSFFLVPDPLEA